MRYIHCLNKISSVGLSVLPKSYALTENIEQADAILVRSAVMHDMILPPSIKVVARAGAGVNNIPLDAYAEKGIIVFNTPGANANAVKELTLAGMLLASRDIVGGISWIHENKEDAELPKTVEKIKAKFGGTEIKGKTIGIIGLGAIGMELARSCSALGMKVIGTKRDLSSIDRLDLPENMVLVKTKEEMIPSCDFISLNVPLTPETKHMINRETIQMMKDQVILLNFARDQLVDDYALSEALQSRKVRNYVTDFPNQQTAHMPYVINIPHLGASTEEAEDNCAVMAANQIVAFLEHGNIVNAVNYPDASLGAKHHHRLTILSNQSLSATSILSLIQSYQVVQSVIRANKKGYQSMIFDLSQAIDQKLFDHIKSLEGVTFVNYV